MKYLIVFLLVFTTLPAWAHIGFQPVYQPTTPSTGGEPIEKYCSLGDFFDSYNSTTHVFTCITGGGGGQNNTASNLTPGEGLFYQKVGVDLQFKGLLSGGNLTITSNNTSIILTGPSSTGEANTMSSPTHANSLILAKSGVDLPIKGIACSGSITCSANTTDITINYTASASGNATSLNDLSDVVISSVAQFNILFYNGTQFINQIFKGDTTTCSAGTFVSAYDNQTGDYTCSTPSTTAREETVALWETDRTWTNIGSSYVDVYATANSNGEGVRIDTTGKTTATINIMWTKVGAGTQKCGIIDITNFANILIEHTNLANGQNTNATVNIPAGLANTIKTYKPMCLSTTATDDPTWLSGQVLLK